MKFKVVVYDDGLNEVDFSIELLSAPDAQRFIRAWQALQEGRLDSVAHQTLLDFGARPSKNGRKESTR